MKPTFFLIVLFVLFSVSALTQTSALDSIIAAQPDSVTRCKLISLKQRGLEKHLNVKNYTPDDLINSAKKYLGTPHCMGGNGKTSQKADGRTCIDCSGLLHASFNDIGLNIDIRSSQELARYGKIITDTSQIQKGDLLFFIHSYRTSNPETVITHAAISLGDKLMIHTSASNGVEVTRTDSEYWGSRFLFATRIF